MATEKRLIDAYALMNQVRESKVKNPHTDPMTARNHRFEHDHFTKLICLAPTVDAVEVVHGRWKYYHKQNIAVCTNCSFERDLDANFGKAVSCPNCGAKMDGGADNGKE
jgi:hypothetical protein